MIFPEDKYRFMYGALQEAVIASEEKEIPVGAVIVHNNRIIAKGHNQIEKLNDPTAHAEMIAITSASNYLKNRRLEGCSVYVTLEPCIMCTGALLASRVDELYFALHDSKFGACGSIYNLAEDSRSNHKLKVYSGIYAEESRDLLDEFFKKVRTKSVHKPNPHENN
ncbi:MAG: tRNA adenosine(34) deaminase TadA [Ignavibacteriaceae bacterium]